MKINKIMLLVICMFFVGIGIVCGKNVDSNIEIMPNNLYLMNSTTNVIKLANEESGVTCESIFGTIDPSTGKFDENTLGYWIKWALDVIKYIAITALVVLSAVDFFQAIVSDNKDDVKKAGSKTLKRFVYVVLIFFLPIIVEVIMKQFGASGTCNIGSVIIC